MSKENRDYKKGFQTAVKVMNKLLMSEYRTYRKEMKMYGQDTDYLSAYENKVRLEDISFYYHEFQRLIDDTKTKSGVSNSCKCYACKNPY